MEQIKEFFGEDTKVSLSREISKKFEETKRGTVNELIDFSKSKTLKGEIVLIINNVEQKSDDEVKPLSKNKYKNVEK